MVDPTADDATRAELEGARAQLEQQVAGLSPAEVDEGFADAAQVSAEQGEALRLAAELQADLEDVEAALARLDAGTYGRCESCGEAIAAERLDALPAARRCIAHA